eukprot:6525697-Prymnesium_polylepis.1
MTDGTIAMTNPQAVSEPRSGGVSGLRRKSSAVGAYSRGRNARSARAVSLAALNDSSNAGQ